MSRRPGLVIVTTLTVLAAVIPPPAASAAGPAPAPSVVAHRGASAYAPENTIAAFELAAEQGADLFELDVQETRDHRLVLMHDDTLARTTDAEKVFPGRAPWPVSGLSLAEIRKLDAGSWFDGDYADEPVPTLAETLRAMSGSGLGLLLEIKAPHLYPGIESRVAAELRRAPAWLEPGRLVVQSFDWDSMRRFHALMPDVPIGLLGKPSTGRLAEVAGFADEVNPPYQDVTPEYVRLVHARGMRVLVWTVDDPAVMRRMLGHGVDGIITNRPDVLRDVVGEDRRRAA
ncbi:glycerophosphodiester phosphodiesterase [Nonomuraea sp. 3-1Str]|uniref:glycerophosphodiester phosphodiesterase n=1 Tax=Nonomuraea sp. 3-1Str TaxID=2929801 RepID=UPI0028565766|nr:glycerophosphodiester phosphodiesterase family protein [Nonomuraea sp. 3-1Str]MDR8413315.1 glycerophosphodiester phosphodiesterase [Nonomuraea sp. 3-1Str]